MATREDSVIVRNLGGEIKLRAIIITLEDDFEDDDIEINMEESKISEDGSTAQIVFMDPADAERVIEHEFDIKNRLLRVSRWNPNWNMPTGTKIIKKFASAITSKFQEPEQLPQSSINPPEYKKAASIFQTYQAATKCNTDSQHVPPGISTFHTHTQTKSTLETKPIKVYSNYMIHDFEKTLEESPDKCIILESVLKNDTIISQAVKVSIDTEIGNITITGPQKEVSKANERILEVILAMDTASISQTFSGDTLKMFKYELISEINTTYHQNNIGARICITDTSFSIVGKDEQHCKRGKDIFPMYVGKAHVDITIDEHRATETQSWKRILQACNTPPRVTVYSFDTKDENNRIHGRLCFEGMMDSIDRIKNVLVDWLHDHAEAMERVILPRPTWNLLKTLTDRCHFDVCEHFLQESKLKNTVKCDFISTESSIQIEGSARLVQSLKAKLQKEGPHFGFHKTYELSTQGISKEIFTEGDGAIKIEHLEKRFRCHIDIEEEIKNDDDTPQEGCANPTLDEISVQIRDVELKQGRLSEFQADVLVCTLIPNKEVLKEAGTIAKDFASHGRDISEDYKRIVDEHKGTLTVGEVIPSTKVGNLSCKYIFYVTLAWGTSVERTMQGQFIDMVISQCLTQTFDLGLQSIAFPALGCGGTGFHPDTVAKSFGNAVPNWKKQYRCEDIMVAVIAYSETVYSKFKKIFESNPKFPEFMAAGTMAKPTYKKRLQVTVCSLEKSRLPKIWEEFYKVKETLCKTDEYPIPGLKELSEAEKITIATLRRNGIHTQPGSETISFTGIRNTLMDHKEKIQTLVDEIESRINDPSMLRMQQDGNTFLESISKQSLKLPNYWERKQNFTSAIKMYITGTLVEVKNLVLFEAIKRLVMDTWQPNKVGRGHDAEDLTHKNIEILSIKQNENIDLFEKYDVVKKQECRAMSVPGNDPAKVADLDKEVITADAKNAVLNAYRLPEINEYFLFHGCPKQIKDVISKEGFDFRLARNGMFGKGAYMAESPVKADQYADRKGARQVGELYMWLGRVLLGNPYIAKGPQNFNRPPCSVLSCNSDKCSNVQHPKHNSVIGVYRDAEATQRCLFREFVIYEHSRAYPEFLIKYKRIE